MEMESFEALARRTGELLERMEDLDAEARDDVFELLDCIDALHRRGLEGLTNSLDPSAVSRASRDEAAAWLLDAYGLGPSEAAGSVPVQITPKR